MVSKTFTTCDLFTFDSGYHRFSLTIKHCMFFSFNSERECLNYAALSSASRSSTYQLPKGSSPSCDDGLSTGWYRFSDPAGDKMASTCLPSGKCGTVVTGWLQTAHPKTADGIVSGKVCFRWGSNCCQWSQNIHLRNCGRFYVYKLVKTFACPMRFCAIPSLWRGKFQNIFCLAACFALFNTVRADNVMLRVKMPTLGLRRKELSKIIIHSIRHWQ